MQSFSEIIDTLGGPSAAARVLATSTQNCQQMRQRNNIPPQYWPAVVEKIDGLTFDTLVKLAAERAS